MSDIRLVYTTWPDPELAAKAGAVFVSERLAACCNILPGALSYYWWRGEVQADTEAVMILKTTKDKVKALSERVDALHPFELPAFTVVDVDESRSSSAFMEWIKKEARGG